MYTRTNCLGECLHYGFVVKCRVNNERGKVRIGLLSVYLKLCHNHHVSGLRLTFSVVPVTICFHILLLLRTF